MNHSFTVSQYSVYFMIYVPKYSQILDTYLTFINSLNHTVQHPLITNVSTHRIEDLRRRTVWINTSLYGCLKLPKCTLLFPLLMKLCLINWNNWLDGANVFKYLI